MAPNSVLLFSTAPPIISFSVNPIHDKITFDTAAFDPFQRISVDASEKTISLSTRKNLYRTVLGIYLRTIASGAATFV